MTTLSVPMVSQLSNLTQDHLPSENQQMDCVPACLCAGIMCLLGVSSVSTNWNPDRILNMAYPEGYQGGTSAANYVQACATFGITLFSVQGNNDYLVQEAHHYVDSECPVLCTIPDPYVDLSLPQFNGWTHVNCIYQTGSGSLTAMDPYPVGHPVSKSDATWASLLQFGEIWILQKAQSQQQEEHMSVDIHTPVIAAYYKQLNATQWQCLKNGYILQGDNLKWYCNNGTVPYCGFSSMGLILSNEIPIENVAPEMGYPFAHLKGNNIVVQFGERQVIAHDPKHMLDNPDGSGATYPLQLYNPNNPGPGTDPAIWALLKTQADLQSQLAQDQTQITDLQQQLSQQGQPDPLIAEVKTDLTALLGKLG